VLLPLFSSVSHRCLSLVGMPGFRGVWCFAGVWRAALSCRLAPWSGLASLSRAFSRSPPCVPPGCGSCLSGTLVSRVPLWFVCLSLASVRSLRFGGFVASCLLELGSCHA
jgi:hypothetical protein